MEISSRHRRRKLAAGLVLVVAAAGLATVANAARSASGRTTADACPNGLLTNWSFESGISGWTIRSGTTASAGAPNGFSTAHGSKVGYVRGPNGEIGQDVPAAPGGTYVLTGFGGTHNTSYRHELVLAFLDADGAVLAEQSVDMDHTVDTEAHIFEFQHTGTAPSGAATVRVSVRASGDWTKIDAVCLTGPTLTSPPTVVPTALPTTTAAAVSTTAPRTGGPTTTPPLTVGPTSTTSVPPTVSPTSTVSTTSTVAPATTTTEAPRVLSPT